MYRVKVFSSVDKPRELENDINEFLRENKNIELVNVSFGYVKHGYQEYQGAIVAYKI